MRKIAAVLLCLALLAAPVLAAEGTVQDVEVDGQSVRFAMYTVYDSDGFATNYVKLRDVAWALRDTPGHFAVSYDGSTRVTTGGSYTAVGGENQGVPDRAEAKGYRAVVTVDGVGHPMDAYLITPKGSTAGNFYFKLRDLGKAIGFTVGWTAERGVYIETQ